MPADLFSVWEGLEDRTEAGAGQGREVDRKARYVLSLARADTLYSQPVISTLALSGTAYYFVVLMLRGSSSTYSISWKYPQYN